MAAEEDLLLRCVVEGIQGVEAVRFRLVVRRPDAGVARTPAAECVALLHVDGRKAVRRTEGTQGLRLRLGKENAETDSAVELRPTTPDLCS